MKIAKILLILFFLLAIPFTLQSDSIQHKTGLAGLDTDAIPLAGGLRTWRYQPSFDLFSQLNTGALFTTGQAFAPVTIAFQYGCADATGTGCGGYSMITQQDPSSDGVDPGINASSASVFPYIFNGTTWDRQKSVGFLIDGATQFFGGAGKFIFNGTDWDKARSITDSSSPLLGQEAVGIALINRSAGPVDTNILSAPATTIADQINQAHILSSGGLLYDGGVGFWERARSASTTVLTDTTSLGIPVTTPLSTWSETDSPAAATQAIASKAAGAAGVSHVSTSVTACFTDSDSIDVGTVNLRDGATGAGSVIWSIFLALSVADDSKCITTPITFTGTAATAMTLEFAAAGTANSLETVTITGYSVVVGTP